MIRYKILESVEHHGLNKIHDYRDLGIHHPGRNHVGMLSGHPEDFEAGRMHRRMDGRFEEVRPMPDGRVLIKKDFILTTDDHGLVHVPSPADGHVHYLHDHWATVRIYDKPSHEPDAKLIAQVLHMDARTFGIQEGAAVQYGQPLGVMSDTGTPGAIHAHVEMESGRFQQYIHDIDSGVITPDHYPAQNAAENNITRTNTSIDDASHAARESSFHAQHPSIDQTKELQQQLNHLGYFDPHDQPLTIDGTSGPNTEHAIRAFQHAHQLHADGVAGKHTLAALVDAHHSPLLSEATHPAHLLYTQVLQGVQKLPHGTFKSEDEQRNLAVALTIAANVDGLKKVDHVVIGTNGVNVFAVQGRLDDPAHLRTNVDRVEAMTHVVHHGRLAYQQAEQAHALHAHMQVSPDVGQRTQGMEINR